MFLEIALFLLCAVIAWYVQFRPHSPYNVRPTYHLLNTAPKPEPDSPLRCVSFDFVVLGGGPGGLAAARALVDAERRTNASVLLIERGHETLPDSVWRAYAHSTDRDRLLSFSPDMVFLPTNSGILPHGVGQPTLVDVHAEDGTVCQRPFRSSLAEEEDNESEGVDSDANEAKWVKRRIAETLHSYAPYPRGKGIGGTGRLEWGVHFPPVLNAEEEDEGGKELFETASGHRKWWNLPVSLAKMRNPLSWAFAEAAASEIVKERYMPTVNQPCKRHSVYPALLRVDIDGRRLPLSSALLEDVSGNKLHRLSVLVNHTVLSLNAADCDADDDDGSRKVVESITCASTGGKARCMIRVGKGIVICAGVVQTPRLLQRFAPSTSPRPTSRIRDVLALPMVFRAQARISMDAKNTRDVKGTALWYLAQRGPNLQPMMDTIASLPVPGLGPTAEMRFALLPFGGKDPRRFYQLGWDRALGSFEDGVTILMMLTGVDGLSHPLELDPKHGGGAALGSRTLLSQRHLHPLAVAEDLPADEAAGDGDGGVAKKVTSELTPQLREKVIDSFVEAMRTCRSVTSASPLCHLVPPRGGQVDGNAGEEAVDYGLLKDNPSHALQLAMLMHTPNKKRSNKMKRELVRLLEWAFTCVNSERYMRPYVEQHAYWLGFGSGSSEPFLSKTHPFLVDGFVNAAVGDNSAITEELWSAGGKDTFGAGSVSNAVLAGKKAAGALLRGE